MSFNDWEDVLLRDLVKIKGGKRLPKGEVLIKDKTSHPYIRVRDLSGRRYLELDNQIEYLDEEVFKSISRYTVNEGDIVISIVGTIGLVSIIGKTLDGANLTENCVKLIELKNVNRDYLYYYLTSIYGKRELEKGTVGAVQAKLPIKNIQQVSIKLPNLSRQKAIADILSSLDDKIELNNQMNETLEEMAQALFKRWFVDFEFPNEEGKPYKSSGGEMVESELGMIPKGWDITILDNICSLMTKSVKPFDNPEVLYEHFSLPACDEGKLPVIEFGNQISSNKYMINNSCILISKLNPVTKRIWDPVCKENSICSTEFMVYQPKNLGIKPFCYELINSYRFTEYLLCNVTGSTGSRQRVQPKLTLKYQFAISSRILIEQFSDLVKPMHDKVKVNIEENRILKKTRDSLLPKLMSGEIRVSDLKS